MGAPRCPAATTRVTVTSGIPSMGRFDEVISAANESSAPCTLGGYPSVTAAVVGTPGAVAAVDSSSDATGVPAAEAPRPVRLELRPGQVASAVLGGPDRAPDGGPGCRTFHAYEVGLPGSSAATAVHAELADCGGLFVGPFVLGFDGTAPSGEVVGTAPACRGAASPAPGSAPVVRSTPGAAPPWPARRRCSPPGSPAPYHLVLSPVVTGSPPRTSRPGGSPSAPGNATTSGATAGARRSGAHAHDRRWTGPPGDDEHD